MSDRDEPECYGDSEFYDIDDRDCQTCLAFEACGIKVQRLRERSLNNARRNFNTRGNTSYRREPTPSYKQQSVRRHEPKNDPLIENCTDEDTFFSVLTHNASLEALQSVFDELSNSVRNIPRKSYKYLWTRKKR